MHPSISASIPTFSIIIPVSLCISTCFHYLVVYLGDQKKLECLEGYDADFNASDYSGRTALHVAASTGQVDLVKWLLGRGASVHSRDTNNETPLLAAVKAGHLEIVRVSLKNMINVNKRLYLSRPWLCVVPTSA